MSYDYKKEKYGVFTAEGTKMLLGISQRVKELIRTAGAARMGEAISKCPGLSWTMLACVDYLVELEVLREVTDATKVMAQHRVFVAGPKYDHL